MYSVIVYLSWSKDGTEVLANNIDVLYMKSFVCTVGAVCTLGALGTVGEVLSVGNRGTGDGIGDGIGDVIGEGN